MATKTAARTAKKSKQKAGKKLPACTKKDLRKPKSKRRKCTTPTTAKTVASTSRPSPAGAVAAPPATFDVPSAAATPWPTNGPTPMVTVPAAAVDAPAPSASPAETDVPLLNAEPIVEAMPTQYAEPAQGLSVYSGPFGVAQAQRLLFRAGFGPKPGQAEALAALGVRGAVSKLLNPGTVTLEGPAPNGPGLVGGAYAPNDKWGHIHLDWMDRMIRSTDSLTERMALVLHDWFGVSDLAVERPQMFNHLELLRRSWRGSFRELLQKVTVDPGMLLFLNGAGSHKTAPNENYAREFMELYALGPDRGAYSETDVRQLARAFTGWRNDFSEERRFYNFRFDATRFDPGSKTLFAGTAHQRTGALGTIEGVNAVVDHPLHPSFVVSKLWAYFIPTAPAAATRSALEALYRSSGERLDRLVEAILLHPDLYSGASLTKPPVVFAASLFRARGTNLDTDTWAWRVQTAGQLLGQPPSVSGWNDRAWLSTSTYRIRWGIVAYLLNSKPALATDYKGRVETPQQAIASALAYWGNPAVSQPHYDLMLRVASKPWTVNAAPYHNADNFNWTRQNVLRQLVAAAPDAQVS